ncbi:DUF559 domain-containing protein [Patescibacteria group bacterium]|nr:DUF559 domain-containing protein [Patescibacteria group bacterium]
MEPNIAIYADGDYWHNIPDVKERDKRINKNLVQRGYIVLRFWEHTINDNIQEVEDRILYVVKRKECQ